MIRYPHNTDLYYFLKNKSLIDIPLDDIADIMLKVIHACKPFIVMFLSYMLHERSFYQLGTFPKESIMWALRFYLR